MRIYLILLLTSLNVFCSSGAGSSNGPQIDSLRKLLQELLAKRKQQQKQQREEQQPGGGIDESEPSEEACKSALQILTESSPDGGERKPRVPVNSENLRPLRGNSLRESLSLMEPLDPQEMQMRLEVARRAGEEADQRTAALYGDRIPKFGNWDEGSNNNPDGNISDSE